MSKLPWEPGFVPAAPDPNLIGSITGAVTAVKKAATGALTQATQIGSDVVTDAATVTTQAANDVKAATGAVTAAGEVIGSVVATPSPASPAATPSPAGGSILDAAIAAAEDAGKGVAASLLPDIEKALEKRVAGKVQAELTSVLDSIQGGATPATPSLDDFTKADARSRAFRTLIIGVVFSGIWGLVNVIGNIATVDWTNQNAWPQVISIAATGIIGSVVAYVGRIVKEPANVTNATIIPGPSS